MAGYLPAVLNAMDRVIPGVLVDSVTGPLNLSGWAAFATGDASSASIQARLMRALSSTRVVFSGFLTLEVQAMIS
ncbi:hypothetical protein BM221_002767 [Beauveria bassiana]|uniref:Uncharacterized protein n=1 Tax=Beauveria bassiana TaxID=176275 RepID=A0A2N6NSS1_BEABA|nr:hypothetical protein BM221_002767 [Beauveria bassiana]